ncbi:MAG: hypothetical protein JO035_02420 [Betaproteobacteria bacterium]|nr:hypothetical protein [Betaproteobacteria bacterium]
MELVTGVVAAGVATGLVVYVSRTRRPDRQRELLREALRLGLASSLPVAAAAALCGLAYSTPLTGGLLSPQALALAAACGWLAVVPLLINNLWLGQQRRGPMLALAAGGATLSVAAAAWLPQAGLVPALALVQAAPALLLLVIRPSPVAPRFRAQSHPLRRYIAPGFSIGILSALSTLAARSVVGETLSWHDAGVLQALWRVADWVGAFAGGILSLHFLPRFAAARGTPAFAEELRRATQWIVLPSVAVFAVLFAFQRPLLALLYDESFSASAPSVAAIFAGSAVRVASWIPLFALFAMRRTWAVAVGELFSLPLFATLIFFTREGATLERVGMLWLFSYAAYAAFNWWAMRRP